MAPFKNSSELTGMKSHRDVAGNQNAHPGPEAQRGPLIFPRLCGDRKAWFALYVQVNHEKEVAKRLQEKSIHALLPLMETWSRRKDRRKRIQVPLFPGYVFLNTILDNYTSHRVLRVPGTVAVLSNSEGPLPIPDSQVRNLETLLRSPETLSPHAYLKEGHWVRVARGPLEGCRGILLRQNSRKGRLVVSLDLIEKSVSVEMDVEDVEPLMQAHGSEHFME